MFNFYRNKIKAMEMDVTGPSEYHGFFSVSRVLQCITGPSVYHGSFSVSRVHQCITGPSVYHGSISVLHGLLQSNHGSFKCITGPYHEYHGSISVSRVHQCYHGSCSVCITGPSTCITGPLTWYSRVTSACMHMVTPSVSRVLQCITGPSVYFLKFAMHYLHRISRVIG